MGAQDLINAWGARKYPKHAGKEFRLKPAMGNGGFCPTCDSPFAYVAVYAGNKEVGELRDVQIHEVLAEHLPGATK